jgi:hypothetical protein
MVIVGFVVVRMAQMNTVGRDAVPELEGTFYSGLDRQRWADVFDEDVSSSRMPTDVRSFADRVKRNSHDLTRVDVCQDVDAAFALLQYSNRKGVRNELIALRSTPLAEVKGTFEATVALEWIGYDCVAVGEWSLIGQGFFRAPGHYSGWKQKINKFGLFDNVSLCEEFARVYQKAAEEGISEPVAPASAGSGVLAIEVAKVKMLR